MRIEIIDGIKYRLYEDELTAEVRQMMGYKGDIIIPETVVFNEVTYRVTSIGFKAFCDCSSLTSMVIGNGVTSIGEKAFYYCSSLTSIVIPDSVTSIGEKAFSGCSSLTSMVIPDGVTSIGQQAFCGCFSLTSMVIGNGVTSIGSCAFFDCSSLTSIVIPESVTWIGYEAFSGCESLTSIVIPDSVTSIGGWAFEGCSSLKQDPTQEIEMSNFKYRLLMDNHLAMVLGYSGRSETINIPSEINHEGVIYRVTTIGESSFRDCSSLTSIVIPDGVTSIEFSAFSHCSSLTSITYNGTKEQWQQIALAPEWNEDIPAKVVHCSDGDVELD